MTVSSPFILIALVPLVLVLLWIWRGTFVSFSRAQMRGMLAVRVVIVALLLLAMARPDVSLPARQLSLGFAVDVSGSVDADRFKRTAELVRSIEEAAGADVVTRVVSFAEQAKLTHMPERYGDARAQKTDIAGALRFAADVLPDQTMRRIVLISDGRETTGDARATARVLGKLGVEVDTIPMPPTTANDLAARDLLLPDGLRSGIEATATAVVSSPARVTAQLSLSENGTVIETRTLALERGVTTLRLPVEPHATGLVRYGVTVEASGDPLPGNNHFERLVQVAGEARVLLIDRNEDEAVPLADALRLQQIDVEVRSPDSLPSSLEELSGFDLVIVSEVAPRTIPRLSQSVLEAYVRDLGGGLVVITGPDGLKGQAGTAMARLLPVDLEGQSERNVPPVALVLVIDRSGSMAGGKLEFAKSAALATVDALPDSAKLGVIAFDADYNWVVPLSGMTEKDAIRKEIASLAPGGGTRFYPSLRDAYYTLRSTDSTTRHIVLLTDGLSTDGDDFDALVGKMRQGAVTLSTVAISREADQGLLKHLAELGLGRYHFTEQASDVPRIFVDEAKTAVSNALSEHPFHPTVLTGAEELSGVDFASAPPLRGYVTTRSKLTSEVLLAAGKDPLLVRWRYGLGHVDVFTSDAKARWAAGWLAWPGYTRLWGQLVHAAMRAKPREDVVARADRRGEQLHVSVDVSGIRALEQTLVARALVIDPTLTEHQLPLALTGPGLYEGELPLPAGAGSIVVRPIVEEEQGRPVAGQAAIVDEPYGREMMGDGDDVALLRAVAEESGGRYDPPANEVAGKLGAARRRRAPAWPYLTLMALVLFMPELVLKRVRFGART